MKKILLLLTLTLVAPMIFAQSTPSYVPTNGLVGYWGFNGNANDESVNSLNGSVNSGNNGTLSYSNDRNGFPSASLTFTSNTSWNSLGPYIEVLGTNSISLSSYSINLWIKPATNCLTGELVNKGPDNEGFFSRIQAPLAGVTYGSVDYPFQVSSSQWTMLTFIRDLDSNGQLYLNGNLVYTSVCGAPNNNNFNFAFGAMPSGGTNGSYYPYQGELDDIAIYNRALTQEEITQLYTATPDPKEVAIGTQTWTDKNLDVATYSDGTVIPQVTDPTEWANLTTGAWCYYNNDHVNEALYGKLYNWYAVAGIWNEASKTDARQRKKLPPTGYHIPSDSEWTTLTTYLGGELVAGGAMKEINGFACLPGGCRDYTNVFNGIGGNSYWWSSSEVNTGMAWPRVLNYDGGNTTKYSSRKTSGFSVRCVKDEVNPDAFITTWVTTTDFETLTLPAQPDAPNYTINWGDGTATNTYNATQAPSHTYSNSGISPRIPARAFCLQDKDLK